MIKYLLTIFLCITFWMSPSFALKNEITFGFFPSVKTKILLANNPAELTAMQNQAISLVKKTLNITPESPYLGVKIRFLYDDANQAQAILVYLLSSQNKSFSIVKINLNKNFIATSIQKNYKLMQSDLAQFPETLENTKAVCPDSTVDFVVSNNFEGTDPTIDSIEKEIHLVYQTAQDKGYHPILMDVNDPKSLQPTVQSYQNWMSCPKVKGFYNESHGEPQGILLSDGELYYYTVNSNLRGKLSHNVILFDSCLTFENPLNSSMTGSFKGNAQQYVGGTILLPFGASERTASCFWVNAINHEELTPDMIKYCATKFGLDPDGFGIKGNGKTYLTPA